MVWLRAKTQIGTIVDNGALDLLRPYSPNQVTAPLRICVVEGWLRERGLEEVWNASFWQRLPELMVQLAVMLGLW
jgi:hypothetical protein